MNGRFSKAITRINKTLIPRRLGMKTIWKSEYHICSDAFKAAYAAVVYVKPIRADGKFKVKLE